jgi:hypothetical protein
MKSPRLLPVLTLGLALVTLGGCQHATAPQPGSIAAANPRAVTYALSVSIAGGLQPSPAQWASIQATFSRILAAEGLVLVTDLTLADRILRIDFLPDLTDPENRGQAVIVSVRSNPLRGGASTPAPTLVAFSPYPSSFGWNGYYWGSYYGFGYDPFYGYGNSYYDGFSYGSPTLNPRRPVPPPVVHPPGYVHHEHHTYPHKPDPNHPDGPRHHHHPTPPEKCPPLLAAAPAPAVSQPDPVVYPGSAPGRNNVFQDDIRLARADRSLAWTTPDSRYENYRGGRSEGYRSRPESNSGTTSAPAEHRSWLSRLINPGDSNSSTAANSNSGRGDRTYGRSDSGGSERTYSRGDSTYTRNDSNSSRSDSYRSRSDSSANSSGSSSYSHSQSSGSGSSSYSSGSSSYSSGSSSYSSGSSSYSSGSSSSYSSGSSSSGSSSSSGGGGSSSAPAPSTTAER